MYEIYSALNSLVFGKMIRCISPYSGSITQIDIKYHKKARGVIQAISNIESLRDGIIKSRLYDQDKFLVA